MTNPEHGDRAQDWTPAEPDRTLTPENDAGDEAHASDPAVSSPATEDGGNTAAPAPGWRQDDNDRAGRHTSPADLFGDRGRGPQAEPSPPPATPSPPPSAFDDGITQTLSPQDMAEVRRQVAAHRTATGKDAEVPSAGGGQHLRPQHLPQDAATGPTPNETGPQPRYYDRRSQDFTSTPPYGMPQQRYPQQFAQEPQQYPQQHTQVPDQWSQQQYDAARAQKNPRAGYTGGDQAGHRAHTANTIAVTGGLTQALNQERHTTVQKPRPQSGWRHAVLVSTFGLVNPGESKIEREDRERRTRVCANVSPPFVFAVLSGKGGAAKTTTTAGLGSVFAKCRGGGEVVVVDANPDEGNLASRVNPDAQHTFQDVLAAAHIGSRSAIRKYTASSPTSQLDVLASSKDLLSPRVYTQDELSRTIATLSNVYNVIGIDCGNDFRSPLVQRVLDTVTAVVVVTGVQFDSGHAALRVHDYLVSTGRAELVKRSFLVMSEHTPVTQDKLRADIEVAVSSTVWKDPLYVPYDQHLYEASVIDLDQLKRATARTYLAGAARLSDWYGLPPVPVSDPTGVGR